MPDHDAIDRALRAHAAAYNDEVGTPHAPGIAQLLADRRDAVPEQRAWTAVGLSAAAAAVVIAGAVTIPQVSNGNSAQPGSTVAGESSSSASVTTSASASPSGMPTPLILPSTASTDRPPTPGEDSKTDGLGTPSPLTAEEKMRADLQTRLVAVLDAARAQLDKDPALTQESINLDDGSVLLLSAGPLAEATKSALRKAAKASPDVDLVFDENAKYTKKQLDDAMQTLVSVNGYIMRELEISTVGPANDGSGLDVTVAAKPDRAEQRLNDLLDVDVNVTVGSGPSTM